MAAEQRVKERFLSPASARPARLDWRSVVGCAEHRAIAEEMAGYGCMKPRALRPGDRIALVAPASPFDRREFDAGLSELRSLGFEPVYEETVFARRGYVAGEADVRATAIRRAWQDPTIAALIAGRGGYGSVQTLAFLDPTEARGAQKAFVGYSDVTAVLSFLTGYCNLVAFHGPMVEGKLARGPAGYDRGKKAYDLYYWRTRSGVEVDFVVYGEDGFWAIEVKNARRVWPADLRSLRAFGEDFPESRRILLYRGGERLSLDGVMCWPCQEFLGHLLPDMPLFV